jgi:hypothetical protein
MHIYTLQILARQAGLRVCAKRYTRVSSDSSVEPPRVDHEHRAKQAGGQCQAYKVVK